MMSDLQRTFNVPISIAAIEALRYCGRHLVRVRSADGVEGVVMAHGRIAYLWPILQQLIAPYFGAEAMRGDCPLRQAAAGRYDCYTDRCVI